MGASFTASSAAQPQLIRWRYLWYVAAALAVLVAAILYGNLWFLNWVHVMSGVLWTGIDLFMGFIQLPWPQFGWVAAALVLITLMTIQGLGYLLPTSVRVCLELQKPNPDGPEIGRMMSRFYYVVGQPGAHAACHHHRHGKARHRRVKQGTRGAPGAAVGHGGRQGQNRRGIKMLPACLGECSKFSVTQTLRKTQTCARF